MTDDYKNPNQENATFKPEELSIVFDVPITAGVTYTDEAEAKAYDRQVAFVDQFCPEDHSNVNLKVIPVDISRDGVTLLTQYNSAMQSALPHLLEAMSIIAGVKVEYDLMTSDHWEDVTYDLELGAHRLKTEEELWAKWLADPQDEGVLCV